MKQKFKNGLAYSTDTNLKNDDVEEQPTLPKEKQRLRIKTDTKHRAGKIVTLVEGFIGLNEDAETLCKLLKTKCGTGGSAKDGQIVIQGDNKTKIAEILTKEGYNIKSL